MSPQVTLALVVGTAALLEDLRYRTISNWTTLGAACTGLAYHAWQFGWSGFLSSLSGLMVGFFVFFIFYLLGGMGGGDIKLMAGFGAILGGAFLTIQAAVFSAAIGGVLASLVLMYRALKRCFRLREGSPSPFMPYAPAITSGAWLTLLANT